MENNENTRRRSTRIPARSKDPIAALTTKKPAATPASKKIKAGAVPKEPVATPVAKKKVGNISKKLKTIDLNAAEPTGAGIKSAGEKTRVDDGGSKSADEWREVDLDATVSPEPVESEFKAAGTATVDKAKTGVNNKGFKKYDIGVFKVSPVQNKDTAHKDVSCGPPTAPAIGVFKVANVEHTDPARGDAGRGCVAPPVKKARTTTKARGTRSVSNTIDEPDFAPPKAAPTRKLNNFNDKAIGYKSLSETLNRLGAIPTPSSTTTRPPVNVTETNNRPVSPEPLMDFKPYILPTPEQIAAASTTNRRGLSIHAHKAPILTAADIAALNYLANPAVTTIPAGALPISARLTTSGRHPLLKFWPVALVPIEGRVSEGKKGKGCGGKKRKAGEAVGLESEGEGNAEGESEYED